MKLIPLSQTNRQKNYSLKLFSQVDDEDYDYLMQWKWHASMSGRVWYARTNDSDHKREIQMHRLIMKLDNPHLDVDHIDRNGLNNQKSNLRIATTSQNCINRNTWGISKHHGVSVQKCNIHKMTKKGMKSYKYEYWRSDICVNYKCFFLGTFKTEEEAAKAYNEAAMKYHGEFANINKF